MVGNQPGLFRCHKLAFQFVLLYAQDHGEKMKKIVLNIPLPNCSDIVTYAADNKADFKRPASYIHFKVEDPSERLCVAAHSCSLPACFVSSAHLNAM
jgi:hypothetical protein